jgi:hypothetical protein
MGRIIGVGLGSQTFGSRLTFKNGGTPSKVGVHNTFLGLFLAAPAVAAFCSGEG